MKPVKITQYRTKDHSNNGDLIWLTVMMFIIIITVLTATIAGLV